MNRKQATYYSVMLVFSLLAIAPASAQVLVSKLFTPLGGGMPSIVFETQQQIADDLTLTAPAVANHLTWYGNGRSSASFRVRLFADEAGQPAISPFYDQSLATLTGIALGSNIFQFSSPIPDVALNGSTKYWLSIAFIAPRIGDGWNWSFANPGPPGNDGFERRGDLASWQSLYSKGWRNQALEYAFTLESVPEPGSFTLAGILISAFVIQSRARKATARLARQRAGALAPEANTLCLARRRRADNRPWITMRAYQCLCGRQSVAAASSA